MKRYRVWLSLCLIWIASSASAVQHEVIPDPKHPNQKVTVSLPFPFHELQDHEKVIFVQQGGVALLKPNSTVDYLMTGPLRPCIGIVIQNPENGYILLFHKHYTNSLSSIDTFYPLLEVNDPAQLKVRIHTTQLDPDRYDLEWKDEVQQGRTQKEELRLVKGHLISHFGILKENVKATIFNNAKDKTEIGQHIDADSTLLLDKLGNLYSVGLYAAELQPLKQENRLAFDLIQALNYNFTLKLAHDNWEIGHRVEIKKGLGLKESDPLPWEKTIGDPYGSLPFFLMNDLYNSN